MTDEHLSDGEVRRTFDRLERRIDDVAKTMVTAEAWQRENLHMQERIRLGDEDCRDKSRATDDKIDRVERAATAAIKALQKRKDITIGRLLIILTVLATLTAGWWAAMGATRGIH